MTIAMAKTILRLAKSPKVSPTLKKLYTKFGGGAKAKAMARKLAKSKMKAKSSAKDLYYNVNQDISNVDKWSQLTARQKARWVRRAAKE